MGEATITVAMDKDALREATAQAMCGVLTPEIKEKIIAKAIHELLAPKDSWGKPQISVVETLMKEAVYAIAREEAFKLVREDPEITVKVKELVRQMVEKVLASDQNQLAKRMSDAFIESLRTRD